MVTKEDPKNNQVIKLLEVLQESPERDPRAATRGRARFLAEARNLHAAVSPGPFQRLNQWIATNPIFGIRKERSAMMTAITSILLAFAILLGGGGITAYAAQDSLPNDALYPVKLFLEDAQYKLTNDPVEQVDLLTTFANNRFDEITTLVSEGEEVPEEVTTDLQQGLLTMQILAAGLDDENLESTLTRILDRTRDQDNFCNQLGLDEGTDPGLALACYVFQNQNRVAEEGLDSPLEFRQRWGYSQNHEEPEDPEEPVDPGDDPVEPTEEPGDDPVEPTEEPEDPTVDRPGSCTDPDGCKPEETGNPDAGQNGGENENNAINGNNGQNGGQGSSSGYYLYIGTHLYYYSNGIYTYVNGQNGGQGGNGNGGGNGGGGGGGGGH